MRELILIALKGDTKMRLAEALTAKLVIATPVGISY
jgi:hypothetical protein